MIKKVFASVVVLLFVALLGYRVAAARNDTQTRAEDHAQIDRLMWNYDRALEGQNPDAYAALYTPDGQFNTGPNAVKGRAAIEKMFVDLKKRQADSAAKGQTRLPAYVMNLSSFVEFPDSDHAHMGGYWLEFSARTGPNAPASIVGVGRYVEDVQRVNGKWLLKLRDVAPKN